jgi:catechol 2,3-dioxygenase-like lactoylglutathione lyase family enzyme
MHRSYVSNLVIDCDDMDVGVAFWTGALGATVLGRDDVYAYLGPAINGLGVLLQNVPEPKTAKNRMHLDFHTDNVEAEVRRLEALGARRKAQVEHWWVMEDPCGNEFCVVQDAPDELAEHAHTWEA